MFYSCQRCNPGEAVLRIQSNHESKESPPVTFFRSLMTSSRLGHIQRDQAWRRDSYRADSADAGPVRLLVHSGRLVNLTEEEVDLLLELLGGRDYGCTGKLRIW